jgi:hypothetical protein
MESGLIQPNTRVLVVPSGSPVIPRVKRLSKRARCWSRPAVCESTVWDAFVADHGWVVVID